MYSSPLNLMLVVFSAVFGSSGLSRGLESDVELGSCDRVSDGKRILFSKSNDGLFFKHGYEGSTVLEKSLMKNVKIRPHTFSEGYTIRINTFQFNYFETELISINNETGMGKITYTDVEVKECWPGQSEWCVIRLPHPRVQRFSVSFENCTFDLDGY